MLLASSCCLRSCHEAVVTSFEGATFHQLASADPLLSETSDQRRASATIVGSLPARERRRPSGEHRGNFFCALRLAFCHSAPLSCTLNLHMKKLMLGEPSLHNTSHFSDKRKVADRRVGICGWASPLCLQRKFMQSKQSAGTHDYGSLNIEHYLSLSLSLSPFPNGIPALPHHVRVASQIRKTVPKSHIKMTSKSFFQVGSSAYVYSGCYVVRTWGKVRGRMEKESAYNPASASPFRALVCYTHTHKQSLVSEYHPGHKNYGSSRREPLSPTACPGR